MTTTDIIIAELEAKVAELEAKVARLTRDVSYWQRECWDAAGESVS